MRVKIKIIIRIVGILLIIIACSNFLVLKYQNKKDSIEHEKLIRETFNGNISNEKVYDNEVNSDILGYIDFPKYEIKRIIKFGTTPNILDDNYIGLHENSVGLDEIGNVILAGHNVDVVFKVLHDVVIGDQIVITSYTNRYYYKVIDKKEISVFDTFYLDKKDEDILTLITCTNDKSKRLLVLAKR